MANTDRRYIDKNGKMFIPMNLEGGSWNEHFITTPKLICIALILFSAIIIGVYLADKGSSLSAYVLMYGIWFLISFYVTRFIIFEEKYYYKMYKQLKEYEITTPSVFWDIASLKDTIDGAILTYSDAKIGVIFKLERDTITGKPPEFKETHYDALSDFYKEIVLRKYNFVQMNIMEKAGNDPRLDELDKLVHSSDNANIRKLMELEVGHIKNITHHTLYESEYILIYTSNLSKIDNIIDDVIDIAYKALDGAYIGYKILRARDIIELMKEEYGVKYFNYTEATLNMFKNKGVNTKSPFTISKIIYSDGDIQNIDSSTLNKISVITSDFENGTLNIGEKSLKDALFAKEKQNKNDKRVDFSTLSDGFNSSTSDQNTSKKLRQKPKFMSNNQSKIEETTKVKVIKQSITDEDDDEYIDI